MIGRSWVIWLSLATIMVAVYVYQMVGPNLTLSKLGLSFGEQNSSDFTGIWQNFQLGFSQEGITTTGSLRSFLALEASSDGNVESVTSTSSAPETPTEIRSFDTTSTSTGRTERSSTTSFFGVSKQTAVVSAASNGAVAKYLQLGFTPPMGNPVQSPISVGPGPANSNFCCYSGIRCQKAAPKYSIYVSSSGDPIYAPMVSTAVAGLRSREADCRYKVKIVVELPGKEQKDGFHRVDYRTNVRPGDVWIHVGKILQWEFFRHCQQELAPKQVYCILYQSDPWHVLAEPGVCEIWEYTYGNIPRAPVVRTLPAGFLPLWTKPKQNDGQVKRRTSNFDVNKIEWVFMGHLVRGNRKKCWKHLVSMPELLHVKFTNYVSGFREDNWKKLAKKRNVIFLNMHKKCNASFRYDRLETVRLSSVLSFGALMISEPVNAVDTEIFKDIVVFEKNLFGRYSDWSPELKHLLQNGDEIIKFQRRAYALFKEKFEPGRLLSDARVWDAEKGPNCST